MKEKYDIIGDIHGCFFELTELLKKLGYFYKDGIYKNNLGRKLISIGDLTDRGPENLKVIRLIINMVDKGEALYVYGNHCKKFYRYLTGHNVKVRYGFENTVREYKSLPIEERENFKNMFINFYENQLYFRELDGGKLVITHGGIKEYMIGMGNQNKMVQSFCLYGATTGEFKSDGRPIRYDWARDYKGKPFIVYGHTPVDKATIRNNTIDIDQGCVFGGKLTALRYPEMEIVQVDSTMSYVEDRIDKSFFDL